MPSTAPGLKPLPRWERSLDPIASQALDRARALLPATFANLLDEPPKVDWTNNVNGSTLADWSIKLYGHHKGLQEIRVNRLLRSTPEAIPDELLEYLVFHELLHYLLPHQGHDAEFRHLESLWPDAALLDAKLDTLHEAWNTEKNLKEYREDSEW